MVVPDLFFVLRLSLPVSLSCCVALRSRDGAYARLVLVFCGVPPGAAALRGGWRGGNEAAGATTGFGKGCSRMRRTHLGEDDEGIAGGRWLGWPTYFVRPVVVRALPLSGNTSVSVPMLTCFGCDNDMGVISWGLAPHVVSVVVSVFPFWSAGAP